MSDTARRARDLKLLDEVDAFKREPFAEPVWRIARSGRDPLMASASRSRWCNGTFDVLYTTLEKDGAMAEINAMLMLQPIFPSGMTWFVHKLRIDAEQTLRIADYPALQKFGVNISGYAGRS